MAFKLAEAFVEITSRLNPFKAGLSRAQGMLASSLSGMQSLAGGAAAGFGLNPATLGIAGVGIGLAYAVKKGSDLNETLNKVGVIFGGQKGTVSAAADEMARKFGVVKTEFMDASATIGQLLIGMGGQTQAAAAKTSTELTKLAGDASSIFNDSFAASSGKIAAALRGESEPISAYGIDLQETAVKQEALRLGLVKGTKELTTQQKVAARSSLIIRGLAVAQGDLANTQDGFANATRALWGRIQNVLAAFGQAVMPIFERVLGVFNRAMRGVQEWIDDSTPRLEGFSQGFLAFAEYVQWAFAQVAEAFTGHVTKLAEMVVATESYQAVVTALGAAWEWLKGAAQAVFDTIGVVFRNWSLIMGEVGVRVRMYILMLGEIFRWLGEVAGTFASWFADNWVKLLIDGVNAAWSVLNNFGHNLKELFSAVADWASGKGFNPNFKPLLDGFKATADAMPAVAAPSFAAIRKEAEEAIGGLRGEMLKIETKRLDDADAAKAGSVASVAGLAAAAAVGATLKKTGKAGAGDTPKKGVKLETTGLAEWATKIQKAAFDTGADDAKKTAKATTEATGILKDIKKALGAGVAALAVP